jgi:oxidase EvaA
VQLSPTVQATPSNYERVHGGRATPYLDLFLERRGRVLADLLLSEQGSRYLRKRNRNMILEVDGDPPPSDDFAWIPLAEIRALLGAGQRVNMNGRTVISCLHPVDGRGEDEAMSWLADVKTGRQLVTARVPLRTLDGWIADGESIRPRAGGPFEVIGVEVSAPSREVPTWTQPMLAPTAAGHVAFLCQRRRGELQLLVQARVEPGLIDAVELGPTITGHGSPYAGLLASGSVRLRASQSEDGGRFYHDDTLHSVVEVPEDEPLEERPGYRFMPPALLARLMRRGYVVSIEARSLLACLL